MDIAEIIRYAGGEPENIKDLDYLWKESEESFPAEGIFFLKDDVWRRAFDYCSVPRELEGQVECLIEKVKKDEPLLHLLWNIYYRQKGPERSAKKGVSGWPQPVSLGEERHLFYLLPVFAIADAVIVQHRQRAIPDQITRDTLKKVNEQMTYLCKRDFGYVGLASGHISWLTYYRDEPYVRLGRFEFWVRKEFYYKCYIYRNDRTKESVAFPPDGTRFTYQGETLAANPPENMPYWTSVYQDDGKVAIGTPMSPRGYALNRIIRLDLREWRRLYAVDQDLYAQMHIPQGGNMTPEVCRESLAQVTPFFRKYYGLDIPLVHTTSWIFGSQLWQFLPEKSNLLDFQRNLYCLPMGYNEPAIGIYFIFPSNVPFDVNTAPRDNSLRRGVIDYLRSGGQWKGGAMFFVTEDIGEYGNGIYRRRWDEGIGRISR